MHTQQLDYIKQEILLQDKEVVSDLQKMDVLIDEYANNQGFLNKLLEIKKTYSNIRRVRRDGSCFYRSILFKIFE